MISLLVYPVAGLGPATDLLRSRKHHVVNTHFAIPSGPLGTLAAGLAHVPNVLSVHGGDVYDPTKWYAPHRFAATGTVVRHVLQRADAVVAQSADMRKRVAQYYGRDLAGKLHTVPLPFDMPCAEWLSGERQAVRCELGLDPEAFYLVSVGRLVRRKGYDRLIDALLRLPEPARLVLIGSGPLSGQLRRQAVAAGLESRVCMTGHVTERQKYRFLTASDCYVLSSHHEGFGIVLQEAMAAGLPIVATRHGGQLDQLDDEQSAILIDSNEPEAIAAAVSKIMGEAPLRDAMAKHNCQRAAAFDPAAVAEEYLDIFRSVIRRRRQGCA
jgi:glycosyltransferase involved in cell wall biosynthesis